MATLRDKNKLLTFIIESSEGTDNTPTGTNAVATENLQIRPPVNNLQTNENTGSLDSADDIPIGAPVTITFDHYLRGSGSTAGVAPEIGSALKCCGLAETLTVAAVGAPTLATGGFAATTVGVPSATFTGAADAYKGMPAILTGNPVGPFDTAITTNTAAGGASILLTLADTFSPVPNASTLVTIPANARYAPTSGAAGSIPSATMYVYIDGILYKCVGCRGDFTFKLDAGGAGKFSFTFNGRLSAKSDTAMATPTFASSGIIKTVWNNKNGQTAFLIDRTAAPVTQFTLGMGNTLHNPLNPNQTDGFDPGDIFGRRIVAEFRPKATLIATRDLLSKYQNGTTVLLTLRAGRSLGGRIAITIYNALLSGYSHENQGGVFGEVIPVRPQGTDSSTFAFVWY